MNLTQVVKIHLKISHSSSDVSVLMKNEWAAIAVEGKLLNLYEIVQIITKFQLKSNLPRFPSLPRYSLGVCLRFIAFVEVDLSASER